MRIRGGRDVSLLFILAHLVASKERVWKYDTDISNPANWIDGKLADNCRGIHFSPLNDAPVFVKELTTQEIVLPRDGDIRLVDGGVIEFKDNKKCIKLKPLNYHEWYDWDSWEGDNNPAIPDNERIPCDHDDIVFPKGVHTRVMESLGESITVKSIKFGGSLISNDEMSFFMGSETASAIFYRSNDPLNPFTFNIKPQSCRDPFGCFCHQNYIPCSFEKPTAKVTCLNPILPEDFCREICGAYITFKPKTSFQLGNLRQKLGNYDVDTYASRVKDYLDNDVIQVVFTEKDFTGRSLEAAQEFLQDLEATGKISNPQMQKSGHFIVEGGGAGTTLSLIFGTLVLVGAFFGVLLYLNGDTRLDLIVSRLNRGRGSLFTTPFFARFDTADQGLIIEGQSLSGSVLDVSKSFDNPMYDHPQSDPHTNPLYDVALKKEQDDQE